MSTRHFLNEYEDKVLELASLNQIALVDQALSVLNNCIKKMPPVAKHHDGGLYVGFVGLSYTLLRMSNSPLLSDKKIQLLNQAKYFIEQDTFINSQQKRKRDDNLLSFLLGNVGTLALSVVVHQQLGLKVDASRLASEFIDIGTRFLPQEIFGFGSDELFVGKAGYLSALLLVQHSLNELSVVFPNDLLYGILDSIVNSGQLYSQKNRSRSPLMYAYYNTEYLGAGHGLAGILFVLMKFPQYLQTRPAVVALIQQSLNYMISITPTDGNLPPATDDVGRKHTLDSQLTHWCHGASGAVYAYGRAFYLWRQDKYLQAAVKCGEVIWKFGLLKKGPGICHGIAGSGYAFLMLYRLTSDERYLNRASCFCNFLNTEDFKSRAKIPDNPYSLFEGWAGTACFIADLATPAISYFPFFDVFD